MSLPNHLAKIKSSGIYRFVFDKSQIPPQEAETLRLVVGYSEKGPFNTPVYVDNIADFINIFGNISKRLEKRGVFFHRMAIQALSAGPILALNVKPFDAETVSCLATNPAGLNLEKMPTTSEINVKDLYNTKRFWKLEEDDLPAKINKNAYINIAMTDVKESSCSIFIRPFKPKSYHLTVADYFNQVLHEEIPEYLKPTDYMDNYFADVYVFKGEFSKEICTGNGPLADYFVKPEAATVSVKTAKTGTKETAEVAAVEEPAFVAELVDKSPSPLYDNTLDALANDPNSHFIAKYSGCTLPYMKDANGYYISLDVVFNRDIDTHKMIMKFDDDQLYNEFGTAILGWDPEYSKPNAKLKPIYLKGYNYSTISKTSSKKEIQTAVFKSIDASTGIFNALTNNVDAYYRYIVDTFETLPSENKLPLFNIAKTKQNAFAILNFPPIKSFTCDVKDIPEEFTMPIELNGASFGAYYTSLKFADGALKVTVPSAALVSNNFMNKYSSRLPYYIVAGPNYGRMDYQGLIGPDYNFNREELDVLEPFGVNAMVFVPRKGTFINSNQTAKQVPVSALSKVHVRELVIYLQDAIESMLQNYQWELNTSVLRDNIKAKADSILEVVKDNGGIYDYLNICDSTNNTAEVIDNEMIILDTHIEPARGAGKMVQQLRIHKTGGISSITL